MYLAADWLTSPMFSIIDIHLSLLVEKIHYGSKSRYRARYRYRYRHRYRYRDRDRAYPTTVPAHCCCPYWLTL